MDLKDIQPRESVMWFAKLMEAKLRENDHKKHWSEMDLEYLETRLEQEKQELEQALIAKSMGAPGELAAWEAADVGNFAMMIAEIAMGIEKKTRRP